MLRSDALARCLDGKKLDIGAAKTRFFYFFFGRLQAPLAPNSWSSASKKRPGQDDGQVSTRLYRARGADVDRPDYTAQQARVQKTPKLSGSSTPINLGKSVTPLKNSRVKTPTDDCCHSSRPVGPPNKENRRFYLKTGA